ncbi:MAG: TonB-dependent receptor plug domain-containing protein, partial [Gemmatimonadales bacterium]
MRAAILVAIGGIVLAGPGALAAQEPVIKRPAQDTTGTDTLPPRPDSVSSTQRLLKAEQGERVRLRPLPHAGTATVLPPGGRIVLTRDSIDWAVAGDLGELLARVPGVYLERGGWLTAPDQPNYLGLGAGSVEYYLDGVPWRPIGVDSVAADPSIMPLGFLDRVEIEPTPGMLRVFLFTRAHDRESPRTKIGAAQGDRGTSRYFGSFERRYVNGLGLGLAADYLSLNRNGAGFGGGNIASGWAQFGYVPSPHFGVQAQLVTERVSRNLLMDDAATDTLARQVDGTRTDEQLRASWHGRSDGLGSSLDLIAAHSSWASDSAPGKVGIGTLGGIFAVRHPTWSSQVSLWHDTQWMPLDARFEAGIAPMGWFSSTVETAMQSYGAGRRAVWGQVRIGLRGPAGLSAGAAIGGGQRLLTPAIAAAKPQRFTDAEVNAAFTSRLLTIDAAYRWNDAWRPVAFPEFMAIDSYAPLPDIHWVTGHARLSPLN